MFQKDLNKRSGVVFDGKVTLIPHIDVITNKAYECLSFVLRLSKDRSSPDIGTSLRGLKSPLFKGIS